MNIASTEVASSVPALVDDARVNLPATYEAARKAIALCDRLDECRNWSDKAAALAAYARMRDDDSLRVLAVRIADRAARRYAALFEQLHPRQDAATRYGHDATVRPAKTRIEAAQESGTSERQLRTALRINQIPEGEFNRLVEGPNPPSPTQLAEYGRQERPTDPNAEAFKATCAALHTFARFCDANDPKAMARAFAVTGTSMARQCVATLDGWLDRFVTNLGSSE